MSRTTNIHIYFDFQSFVIHCNKYNHLQFKLHKKEGSSIAAVKAQSDLDIIMLTNRQIKSRSIRMSVIDTPTYKKKYVLEIGTLKEDIHLKQLFDVKP